MRNDELKGKRLLLLGSGVWKDQLRQIADDMGITLLFAGNSASPLDEVVDETWRVDSLDHEAMKRFIGTHHIDGVFMGGSELVVSHACEYVNELGYPCYCNKEQWEAFENKVCFKHLLMKYGLPCAKLFFAGECDELPREVAEGIEYPVVTKPVDGGGGVGFSVCRNMGELTRGYERAREASLSGRAMVEAFVRNESVKVIYGFSDGEARFLLMADKYRVKYTNPESYVVTDHVYRSSLTDDFRSRYEGTLVKMFRDVGIREGTLWMEVFKDGDNYCFNEAGFRYLGNISVYPVEYFTGINQMASDITFALTGHSQFYGHRPLIREEVPRKTHYCMRYVHLREGKIARIEGVEAFRSLAECVYLYVLQDVGAEIKGPRTIGQCFASVHLVFDTAEELRGLIKKLHETVHVTGTDGEEMMKNIEPFIVDD